MIWFQSLTKAKLADLLLPLSNSQEDARKAQRQAKMRASQIFKWFYQRNVASFDEMTDLSLAVRKWLLEHVQIYKLELASKHLSQDGTHKFLWKLWDQKTIESVIIPFTETGDERDRKTFAGRPILDEKQASLNEGAWKRHTACISSQVGCAMGCKFCLTGIQGLDRHLKTHEIVAQIHELNKIAPLSNIVFMGMGEPLHNLESVIEACEIFLDQEGFNFSKRKVTVSTSGLVPAIETLGSTLGIGLAISLNATTNEIRNEIMPINRKWPIEALLAACRKYPSSAHRKITFEYVLLKDVNDQPADAERLLNLLRGMHAKVNLIPFNEHPGSHFKRPDERTIKNFQHALVSRGMTATVRTSRGRDILAACGQLRSLRGTARGSERHRDTMNTTA